MNMRKSISLALIACIVSGNVCLAKDINLKPNINLPGMVKVDLPRTKEEAKMMKRAAKRSCKRGKSLAGSSRKGSFY